MHLICAGFLEKPDWKGKGFSIKKGFQDSEYVKVMIYLRMSCISKTSRFFSLFAVKTEDSYKLFNM